MKLTLIKDKIIIRSRGTVTAKGYVRLKDAAHRDEYEHRVIQAGEGKPPAPDQDVDHRNRQRADNRPANLRNVKHARHPKVTFKRKAR
jgi:hypothetical protein